MHSIKKFEKGNYPKTRQGIMQFCEAMTKEGYALNTIYLYCKQVATEYGIIWKPTAPRYSRLRNPDLSYKEVVDIIERLDLQDSGNILIYLLTIFGLSAKEICAIKFEDWNSNEGFLTVPDIIKRGRIIPCPSNIQEKVNRMFNHLQETAQTEFLTHHIPQGIYQIYVNRVGIAPSEVRFLLARELQRNGANERVAGEYMGLTAKTCQNIMRGDIQRLRAEYDRVGIFN